MLTIQEMKRNALFCLCAGMVFLSLAAKYNAPEPRTAPPILEYYPHICTDQTHENCDGECECDGLECIRK